MSDRAYRNADIITGILSGGFAGLFVALATGLLFVPLFFPADFVVAGSMLGWIASIFFGRHFTDFLDDLWKELKAWDSRNSW